MVVIEKRYGERSWNQRRMKMRVVVQEQGRPTSRYDAGETDKVPTDLWLSERGVNPSSIIDRVLKTQRGEKFWLITVAR